MGRTAKEGAAPVGPGVQSLMRGPSTLAPSAAKADIPRWYLFAGDVLLVTLALLTLYFSPHPLSWKRELFCISVVGVAANLAVIALMFTGGKHP